jgi:hypothetical protein
MECKGSGRAAGVELYVMREREVEPLVVLSLKGPCRRTLGSRAVAAEVERQTTSVASGSFVEWALAPGALDFEISELGQWFNESYIDIL